jgi:hypothetical protein
MREIGDEIAAAYTRQTRLAATDTIILPFLVRMV